MRGRWCNIILTVLQQVRRKVLIQKNIFYEKLQQVLNHVHKYNMKILLGEFNANLDREEIFKSTVGNDTVHRDSKKY